MVGMLALGLLGFPLLSAPGENEAPRVEESAESPAPEEPEGLEPDRTDLNLLGEVNALGQRQ